MRELENKFIKTINGWQNFTLTALSMHHTLHDSVIIRIQDLYFSKKTFIKLILSLNNHFKGEIKVNRKFIEYSTTMGSIILQKIRTNTLFLRHVIFCPTSLKIKYINFDEKHFSLQFMDGMEKFRPEILDFMQELDYKHFMEFNVCEEDELIRTPLNETYEYIKRKMVADDDFFSQELRILLEDKFYGENMSHFSKIISEKDLLINEKENIKNEKNKEKHFLDLFLKNKK